MQCLYLCDQMILSIIASDLSHIWHVIKFLPSSFLLLNSISVCVTQCVISSRWASIWRKNPESYILKCVFLGVRIIIFFFFFFSITKHIEHIFPVKSGNEYTQKPCQSCVTLCLHSWLWRKALKFSFVKHGNILFESLWCIIHCLCYRYTGQSPIILALLFELQEF